MQQSLPLQRSARLRHRPVHHPGRARIALHRAWLLRSQGKTDGSSNDALKRCLANQLKENGGIGSISEQLLDTRADVTIGGGSKYFRQTVQGGECAGKTVWEQAKEMGYQTVENDPAAIAMIVKTAKISR